MNGNGVHSDLCFCTACRGERKGAELSNTAPSNLHCHTETQTDALETGGIDTLHLSIYGKFHDDVWSTLRSALSAGQAAAQAGDDERSIVPLGGYRSVCVAASGSGKGLSYAKWRFEFRGVIVKLCDRQDSGSFEKGDALPNVFVELGSIVLLSMGIAEALEEVVQLLQDLRYTFDDERICPSRIDGCVDLVDVNVAEFARQFQEGRCVRRTKKWNVYGSGEKNESLYVGGGGPTQLRIYDKVAECRLQFEKYELLKRLRWGREPDTETGATRIEFQVRRDDLRDRHSIRSLGDFEKCARSLFDWLTFDWFRLTEEVPDRGHTERFGPSRLWSTVIEAFRKWTGEPTLQRRPKVEVVPDARRVMKQAIGCLTTAAAAQGVLPATVEELVDFVESAVRAAGGKAVGEVRRKRRVFEARNPIKVLTGG